VLVPLGGAVGTHTHVVNLSAAFAADGGAPLHRGMRQLLEEADSGGSLDRAGVAVASGRWRVAIDAISLRAPLYDPEKIICVGMNYYDHCTEQNFPIPKEPVIFSKFASSIVANGEPLHSTRSSRRSSILRSSSPSSSGVPVAASPRSVRSSTSLAGRSRTTSPRATGR